jgi:L-methionine (R)-S-oxide reductase
VQYSTGVLTNAIRLLSWQPLWVSYIIQTTSFDWTGFYWVIDPELLKVGPYQGGHGRLVIPFASGVCGAAARTGKVQRVDDVEAFDGHIACSSSTRSELVMPVFGKEGKLIAVLDIDSDRPNAFDQKDADSLDAILKDVFSDR